MALDYDQVTAISQKYFLKKLADNVFDSVALLNRAKTRFLEMVDGGVSVMMPLAYAQTTASGWFNGADLLSTTDNQNITSAELQWKQSYANVTISRKEELQNNGTAQIVDLVKSKMMIAEKTLRDKWGTGLYNDGTTTNAIIGLQAWLNTSSTVGGISQTTNTWWASNLNSTTTVTTLAALQTLYNLASIGDEAPTVGMAGRTVFNLYYSLLSPQQRFVDKESARAGFSSLFFNGVPILVDSKATASNLFFLNENYLKLFIHSQENFRQEPFIVPNNQAVRTSKIYTMGAFGSNNNRMHARFSALAS